MEFVVIVLFVAAIVLVNFLVGRAQRKRAGRPAAEKPKQSGTGSSAKPLRAPAGTSLEAAREAVAQLDEKGHQQVYAAIAQGQPIRAIQLYAQNTGCGLRAASAAVASMASHPVPFTRQQPRQDQAPAPAEPAPGANPADAAPAADATASPARPADTPEPEASDQSGRGTAARDAAARNASPAASGSGAAGKDKAQEKAKDKEPAAPDDAEISRWAQNLRPEDF